MASPLNFASLNPLAGSQLFSLGTFASAMVIIGIAVVLLGIVGFFIFWYVIKQQYNLKIRVFRKVAGIPTQIGYFVAKEVPFGMAGDKLWRVAPNTMLSKAFKIIKWLPVGKIQTAPFEYWYYIREDGEWINYAQGDIDEISLKAGAKFTQEDMRLQRLATDRLLEQRLMNKSFWEKWKDTIMLVIFFLVIAVCMVLIFYQFSKLLEHFDALIQPMGKLAEVVVKVCELNQTSSGGNTGLLPAS